MTIFSISADLLRSNRCEQRDGRLPIIIVAVVVVVIIIINSGSLSLGSALLCYALLS